MLLEEDVDVVGGGHRCCWRRTLMLLEEDIDELEEDIDELEEDIDVVGGGR